MAYSVSKRGPSADGLTTRRDVSPLLALASFSLARKLLGTGGARAGVGKSPGVDTGADVGVVVGTEFSGRVDAVDTSPTVAVLADCASLRASMPLSDGTPGACFTASAPASCASSWAFTTSSLGLNLPTFALNFVLPIPTKSTPGNSLNTSSSSPPVLGFVKNISVPITSFH